MIRGAQSTALAELFSLLHRHGDLVAAAYDAEIRVGELATEAAVEALARVGVLKPFEGSYFIHPRLREFLNEFLSAYQAYKSLTRLSPLMEEGRELWTSMVNLRRDDEVDSAVSREWEFGYKLLEIAQAIEANITLMQTLVSTRYGNVRSPGEKRRQNVYYQKQIGQLQRELESLRVFCSEMESRATAAERPDLQARVYRTLVVRLADWAAVIKEVALAIGADLFRQRRIEAQMRRLADTALFLRAQPTFGSLDIDPGKEAVPDWAFKVEGLPIAAHADSVGAPPATAEAWEEIARALPPRPVLSVEHAAEDAAPPTIEHDEGRILADIFDVHGEEVVQLAARVRQSRTPVSLVEHFQASPHLADSGVDAWLLFAAVELPLHDVAVDFVDAEPDGAGVPVNLAFKDVLVRATATAHARPHADAPRT